MACGRRRRNEPRIETFSQPSGPALESQDAVCRRALPACRCAAGGKPIPGGPGQLRPGLGGQAGFSRRVVRPRERVPQPGTAGRSRRRSRTGGIARAGARHDAADAHGIGNVHLQMGSDVRPAAAAQGRNRCRANAREPARAADVRVGPGPAIQGVPALCPAPAAVRLGRETAAVVTPKNPARLCVCRFQAARRELPRRRAVREARPRPLRGHWHFARARGCERRA
jgi:hypothetical protein